MASLSGLDPQIAYAEAALETDVNNLLMSEHDMAATEGASEADVATLDAALTRFANLVDARPATKPGAGAADSIGYAALVGF